jgi:tetratricopeptide (TPR) repeat protein
MVLASLGVLAAISALAFALRRSRPWLAAGWGWYLLTLLPVIGIVQVGMQSMADRYMYVPIIGLFIAVAWEASGSAPRFSVAAAALLLTFWAVLSFRQIAVWKDGVTLFTRALEVNPDNFLAHDNLGVELDRRGRFDEALEHYSETLRLKPGDRHGEANYAQATFAKGARLQAAGKPDEALAAFREGLHFRPRNALAHLAVGQILSGQGKSPAAIAEFRLALEADPALAAAHMGLAVALTGAGRPAEARRSFEDAIRYDPKNAEAHFDLGLILAGQGKIAEALPHFEAAIRFKPDLGPAHVALAEIYYAAGRYQDSWREILAARAAHMEVDPGLVSLLTPHLRR